MFNSYGPQDVNKKKPKVSRTTPSDSHFGDHQKLSKIGRGYSAKTNFCSIDRRDVNLFLFDSYGPQDVNKKNPKSLGPLLLVVILVITKS